MRFETHTVLRLRGSTTYATHMFALRAGRPCFVEIIIMRESSPRKGRCNGVAVVLSQYLLEVANRLHFFYMY